MNRIDALRTLGLEEDASENEIKLAYRELAQILHPDKYVGNRKLAARAEEQLKRVNEAYGFLRRNAASRSAQAGSTSSAGSTKAGARTTTGARRNSGSSAGAAADPDYRASSLKARLAGIAAARTQLTAQLDHELDKRRIGIGLFIGGLIALVVGQRTGLRLVDGIGGAAAAWGAIQLFNALANIKAVRGHLSRLDADRKKYEQELENL